MTRLTFIKKNNFHQLIQGKKNGNLFNDYIHNYVNINRFFTVFVVIINWPKGVKKFNKTKSWLKVLKNLLKWKYKKDIDN